MSQMNYYSRKHLDEFKSILEEKLKVVRSDLLNKKDELQNLKKPKDLCDGQPTVIQNQLIMEIRRLDINKNDIEIALRRIQTGTYGICIKTGNLIPIYRLNANPTATTTLMRWIPSHFFWKIKKTED